jgi:uncharacterized protein (DUF486 family)
MSSVLAVGLLICSNIFMTLAWYGHLKWFKGHAAPILLIILLSWGLAFFEYCFQVPANRIGYTHLSATQLKVIQEVISISVFIIFAVKILGEPMKWNHWVAFGLIAVAVYFATAFK